MVLNWERITVTAAAEQKPDMTGADIKSIMNPVLLSKRFKISIKIVDRGRVSLVHRRLTGEQPNKKKKKKLDERHRT